MAPRSARRRLLWAAAALVVAALATFAWQAVSASRALMEARRGVDEIRSLVVAGDFTEAAERLRDVQAQTAQARDSTDGWLWDVLGHAPAVGPTVEAVQTVADALDRTTRDNSPTALALSQAVAEGRFRPERGRLDLAAIAEFAPRVAASGRSIGAAADRIDEVDRDDLIFPLGDLVGELQDRIRDARSAASAAATAFELLPDLLGGDGTERTYLLVVQNPAELRATGGLPGSLALLHARNGKVEMGWQGGPHDIGGFASPVAELPEDLRAEYGEIPGIDFRSTNLTPDFPTAAQLMRTMVERRLDVHLDGVVAVDPVAMAGLLNATGPVQVQKNFVINAGNAVQALLNGVYQTYDTQAEQNEFFERAARKVFDAVMSGAGNQQVAVRALGTAVNQRRILLWLADDAARGRIAGTAVSGDTGADLGRRPRIGIYLNDTMAGKMDYYLRYRATASPVACRGDRSQDFRASVRFTSTMPKQFDELSSWIVGNGSVAPQGTIAFAVRFYAPLGGELTEVKVDGEQRSPNTGSARGRPVTTVLVSLAPGESSTIDFDVRSAPGQDADGILELTPGVQPAPNGIRVESACS